uniref:Uncharacterized protein n=1 Tax=Anguilla anguilla TaxID=7936 RepID=A0A0E9URJ9_ANGAN
MLKRGASLSRLNPAHRVQCQSYPLSHRPVSPAHFPFQA